VARKPSTIHPGAERETAASRWFGRVQGGRVENLFYEEASGRGPERGSDITSRPSRTGSQRATAAVNDPAGTTR
jgi:hypothetical protein